MTSSAHHRQRCQGFVLIAVLSVMAVLSAIVILMLISSRTAVETAQVADSRLATDAMIQAGVSVAAYQLFVLKFPPGRVRAQQIRLAQGMVTLTADTDAAKADLNASGKTLLATAYRASGLTTLTPQSFAARVVDWRDADDVAGADGAEAADYRLIGVEAGPANRPFRSVADLRGLPGISAADITTLEPLVTVYNPRGRLDVFSALPALIAALPNVDADTVAAVVAARKTRTAASIARLEDLLLVQSSLIDSAPPVTYGVTITVRPNGAGPLRTVTVTLASGVAAGSAYHILQWDER